MNWGLACWNQLMSSGSCKTSQSSGRDGARPSRNPRTRSFCPLEGRPPCRPREVLQEPQQCLAYELRTITHPEPLRALRVLRGENHRLVELRKGLPLSCRGCLHPPHRAISRGRETPRLHDGQSREVRLRLNCLLPTANCRLQLPTANRRLQLPPAAVARAAHLKACYEPINEVGSAHELQLATPEVA